MVVFAVDHQDGDNTARARPAPALGSHIIATVDSVPMRVPPGAAPAPAPTADTPPAFTPLISDAKMQAILQKRWQECVICVRHGAPLGATVMMGGILEGLLLARINQLPSQAPVHTAAAAPKDKSTGKTLQLKDWGLKNLSTSPMNSDGSRRRLKISGRCCATIATTSTRRKNSRRASAWRRATPICSGTLPRA